MFNQCCNKLFTTCIITSHSFAKVNQPAYFSLEVHYICDMHLCPPFGPSACISIRCSLLIVLHNAMGQLATPWPVQAAT